MLPFLRTNSSPIEYVGELFEPYRFFLWQLRETHVYINTVHFSPMDKVDYELRFKKCRNAYDDCLEAKRVEFRKEIINKYSELQNELEAYDNREDLERELGEMEQAYEKAKEPCKTRNSKDNKSLIMNSALAMTSIIASVGISISLPLAGDEYWPSVIVIIGLLFLMSAFVIQITIKREHIMRREKNHIVSVLLSISILALIFALIVERVQFIWF